MIAFKSLRFVLRFSSLLAITATAAFAQNRTPWTTSRVHGSPEPPKPFVSEQAFTGVTFDSALDMVPVPGLGQWIIVENGGKLWSMPDDPQTTQPTLALDLKAMHPAVDHAYGVVFHPKFKENKQVFVTYTNGDKLEDGSRLSRFIVKQEKPLVIDPASEEVLLTWLSGGHNGAAVAFGADGFLYLSTGDAEVPAPPDPRMTGQNLTDLLSCILRIDVDRKEAGKAYAVPKDNPFVEVGGARPEIWAYGLRNPWKISFDRKTGNLWCGDVGWEQWEQVYLITRGGNYGWSAMEGNNPVLLERKGPTPISPPVVTHSHTEAASMTGGFVYHGKRLPELEGAYVYGDYETGKIWALWHDGKQITRHEEIADTAQKIVTFGQSEDGELYFIHWNKASTFHRLARNPNAGKPSNFPRKLSETGIFADVAKQTPAAGVEPFDIRAPMWEDGAKSQRYIGMPSGTLVTSVKTNAKGKIDAKDTWPAETVLAKTLSMQFDGTNRTSTRPVETQVLYFDGEAWNGYTYRWNDAATDAELVGVNGDERTLALSAREQPGGKHRHEWRFHSRGECMRCHNSWSGFALGFQPQQLTEPSTEKMKSLGFITDNFAKKSPARLSDPHEERLTSEARARSWLHANCAHCHRENGGGSVPLMLNAEMATLDMRAVNEPPTRGDFGMKDAKVIMPGSPWKSVLLHRIATSSSGHMPVIGAHDVDSDALGFMAEWILSMTKGRPLEPPNPITSIASPEMALDIVIMRDMLSAEQFEAATRLAAKSPNPHIRGLFDHYLPDSERIITLGASASAEKITAKKGDARRGAELFSGTGKAAACLACHFINGSGRDFGPDLSKVGSRLTPSQIIESLLTPSKVIAQGFQPVVITLNDGTLPSGFIVKRDDSTITLKIMTGQTLPLKKSDVNTEQTSPVSFMPEGLLQVFTAQEAADLVEYLVKLK